MFMPLEGVRVIDLTHYTAGPYGTRILADYGADVIKIERPGGGDPARRIGPFYHDEPDLEKSGLFLFLNTNKRSITLDFKTEKGKQIIKELVKDADILIENFPPDVMTDAGLGYEELSQINPRLVMTSISNFGKSGPYKDWVGLDLTLYAMGGNMWGSGDPELEPLKTAGRMASFHVGYAAALASALGLTNAELRGQGENIDVSYFEVTLQSIDGRMQKLLGYQYNNQVPMRVSPGASLGLGSGIYPCLDGMFMTTAGRCPVPQHGAHGWRGGHPNAARLGYRRRPLPPGGRRRVGGNTHPLDARAHHQGSTARLHGIRRARRARQHHRKPDE